MGFRLSAAVCALAFLAGAAQAADFYVEVGAEPGGRGAQDAPFASLAQAEAASAPGDTIYLTGNGALDGAIRLKPGQRLLGVGPNVELANTAGAPSVVLAENTEVAGLMFTVGAGPAIVGGASISGAWVHDNQFMGGPETAGDPVYAVELAFDAGLNGGVRLTGNRFRDSENMGGVRITQAGDSRGDYLFERNVFRNLGGRALYILTREDSHASTVSRDDTAINIGMGDRNADSILPYLMGRSSQTVAVHGFQYSNPAGVGNGSNTGLEVFVYGRPRPEEDRINWCVSCSFSLTVEDSVFDSPVSDGIQISNFGIDTQGYVAIRNTRIVGANPQQVGGAVSVSAEQAGNSGSQIRVLVENSDLIGSSRFGVGVTDRTPGPSAVVDLGGGPLGSKGGNRIVGSGEAAVNVVENQVWARYNWWGGEPPAVLTEGEGAAVDVSSPTAVDPRP